MDEPHILERLRAAIGSGKYSGPVSDAEIADAEETLGVSFPASYKVFLKHYGAAWLPSSYWVGGLGPGRSTDPTPPQWVHVIDVTTSMRRASRGRIPKEYIHFSDNGGDHKFYLDTGRMEPGGECPVIVLGPGRDGVVIAHSFVEFVEGAVANRFEY